MLTAGPIQHNAISRLQDEELFGPPPPAPEGSDQQSNGHQSNRLVDNPPNLDEWRQKLFDVDQMITLSEDE
jgi:glutathione S-transferase